MIWKGYLRVKRHIYVPVVSRQHLCLHAYILSLYDKTAKIVKCEVTRFWRDEVAPWTSLGGPNKVCHKCHRAVYMLYDV